MADKLSSPLILKYQKEFEEKPHSRVFVPLAESYRKVGLVEKAIDFLRQGLEFHPNYVTAHVVLGNCYFDLKQYEKALRILSPLFEKGSENLKLLRLLSKTNYELGNYEDSKKFLKYLLFLNPNDLETTQLLEKIEDRVPERVLTDELPEVKENRFNANIQNEVFKDADEWVRVDTKTDTKADVEEDDSNADNWSVGTVEQVRETLKEELPTELSLDLVNIYQSQGLFDRALDILEEYLKVHPKKQQFLDKKDELLAIKNNKRPIFETQTIDELPDDTEQSVEPIQSLEDIPDEEPVQVTKTTEQRDEKTTLRLNKFLSAVKKRAESRKQHLKA